MTTLKSELPAKMSNSINRKTTFPLILNHSIYLLSICFILFYFFSYFNFVEDDVFIPIRYAQNFWRGYGLVMNAGERVEGCTSPIQAFSFVFLLRFLSPNTAILVLKFSGLGTALLVLYQTRQISRFVFQKSSLVADFTILFLAIRPEFTISMTNVMETGITTLAVTSLILSAIQRNSKTMFFWAIFSMLCRPELYFLYPMIFFIFKITSSKKSRVFENDLRSYRFLGLYFLLSIIFLILRFSYYDSLVPNTYFAKHIPLKSSYITAMSYINRYFLFNLDHFKLVITFVCFCSFLFFGKNRILLLSTLAYFLLFIFFSGGGWTRDGRYIMPIMPIFSILCSSVLFPINHLFKKKKYFLSCLLTIIFVCVIAMDTSNRFFFLRKDLFNLRSLTETLRSGLDPETRLHPWLCTRSDGRLVYSRWILRCVPPGSLVAMSEMGLVPMLHPEIRFLDLRGLTDKTIARSNLPHSIYGVQVEKWSEGPLWKYLESRSPDYIAAFDGGWDTPLGTIVRNRYSVVEQLTVMDDHGNTWHLQICKRIDLAPTAAPRSEPIRSR